MRSRKAARRRVHRSDDNIGSDASLSVAEGRYLIEGASVIEMEGESDGDSDDGDGKDGKDENPGPSPAEFLHRALWTNKPREPVSIFWRKDGPRNDPNTLRPITLAEQFRRTAQLRVLYPAMRIKTTAFEWQETTWKGYYSQAKRVARSLLKMGIKQGMRVGIYAANSPKWCIAFMGAVLVGGIPVGIDSALDDGSIGHIVTHASITVLFLGGQFEFERLMPILRKTQYEKLFAVVSFTDLEDDSSRILRAASIYPFVMEEFLLLAGTDESMIQRLVRARQKKVDPGSCACIVYTPGTTARPKACMLSHDNLVWTASIFSGMLGAQESDRSVSYISLSSIYGLLLDIIIPLVTGHLVYFVQKSALQGSLGDTLREVVPTFFVGMPDIFEKIRLRFEAFEFSHDGWAVRDSLLTWAQKKGLAGTYAKQRGESLPWGWTFAKYTTFAPFLNRLGLQSARIVMSIGSHLSIDTLEFFQSMGLQVYECYGSTESTGVITISLPDSCVSGAVGRRLLGTGVTTLDDRSEFIQATGMPLEQEDGEGAIRVYGRNRFMGYFRTRKRDQTDLFDPAGWFITGDYGRFNDGFLLVDGKVKEIITLANGTTINPITVEAKLNHLLPGIEHVVVAGDGHRALTALFSVRAKLNRHTGEATTRIEAGILSVIYSNSIKRADDDVDEEQRAIDDLLKAADIDNASTIRVKDVIVHPNVISYVQTRVDAYNDTAPPGVRIASWRFLPKPLTVYSGELNFVNAVRRGVVLSEYDDLVREMYHQ